MAYHPKLPLMSADQNITAQYPQIAVYFGWPKYHGIVQYLQIAVYVGLPKATFEICLCRFYVGPAVAGDICVGKRPEWLKPAYV